MMDKEPYQALFKNLVEKLVLWKQDDYEIVLTGDFVEDVYRSKFSERLVNDNLRMTERILKNTGIEIPPTHDCGLKAHRWGGCNCRG